ncbi:hypothetical protein ACS0TY_013408 [Phlomoides rotata]
MHVLSRLSNCVDSVSPPSSPRLRSSRGKSPSSGGVYVGGFHGSGRAESKNVVERFGRRGVLLFAPLLYISGILLYMGIMGFDSVNNASSRGGDAVGPGSVYRSPEVFEKLWPLMEAESNWSSNMLLLQSDK